MKPLTLTRIQEIQEKRKSEKSDDNKIQEVPLYRELRNTPRYFNSKMALYR